MYSLLYRKLPGGKLAKAIQLMAIGLILLAFLFFLAFPLFESLFSQDPSIDG